MYTRPLSNTGEPFTSLAGGLLSFELVSEGGRNPQVYDVFTLEPIAVELEIDIDSNGLFTANLWPNDRGNVDTFYLVTLTHSQIAPRTYRITIPSGATGLLWSTALTTNVDLLERENIVGTNLETEHTLPVPEEGLNRKFVATGDAAQTVTATGNAIFILPSGAVTSANASLVSAAKRGSYLELVGVDATTWLVATMRGTWNVA